MTQNKLSANSNLLEEDQNLNLSKKESSQVTPLPMQYLGAKNRISKWILNEISNNFSDIEFFLDLFAGTGSVSVEAIQRGYTVYANDMQPYTYPILSTLFEKPKPNLINLIAKINELDNKNSLLGSGRFGFSNLLDEEDAIFEGFLKKEIPWEEYAEFCAATKLEDGRKNERVS